jgi:hypothetical protein
MPAAPVLRQSTDGDSVRPRTERNELALTAMTNPFFSLISYAVALSISCANTGYD